MVLATIRTLLFGANDENGVESLKAALREPRAEVTLQGVYGEPYLDTQGARTAVFPVEAYDAETGESYTTTALEFPIESGTGKRRLSRFLTSHEIDRSTLDQIEGTEANVQRMPSGNIKVEW